MSLAFVGGSTQYIRAPRDAAIDDLTQWSVIAWVYPTTISPSPNSADIFNKAHAKRFDMDATSGYLNMKQNKSGGVIETVSDIFNTANQWYYVAGVCDATASNPDPQGWLYWGQLDAIAAEVSSYVLRSTAYGGTVETDEYDSQNNTPGDLFGANKPWRNPWEGNRAWYGRIAVIGFWSTLLSLGDIRRQQYKRYPVVAGCEWFIDSSLVNNGVIPDLSGNNRHAQLYGI